MKPSDNLASSHKKLTYHRQYYSVVDITFNGVGRGVNILLFNILTPPPPHTHTKYSRKVFWQWNPVTTQLHHTKHLHIKDNLFLWLTFLFRGGVNISWYNILTPPPPPPPIIQERYFDNEIQWQLCFITQNINISKTVTFLWLTFLFNGGVNILWYNILTPPPQPNIQERYFNNGTQCQLSFITQNM